jgi:hypothetical protein
VHAPFTAISSSSTERLLSPFLSIRLEHQAVHVGVAVGESVIKFSSPQNVFKDTYKHSCY